MSTDVDASILLICEWGSCEYISEYTYRHAHARIKFSDWSMRELCGKFAKDFPGQCNLIYLRLVFFSEPYKSLHLGSGNLEPKCKTI